VFAGEVDAALGPADHGRDVPDAPAAYQAARRPAVDRLQQVAKTSRDWFERVHEHVGLPPEEFALHLLPRSGLGVSRQSTSKALRFFKDHQFVAQIADGEDRRELTTTLTPAGLEFLNRAADGRRAAAAIAVLSPGERSLFFELCKKVADALYDHTQAPLEKDE
jgi:hypothetical protein